MIVPPLRRRAFPEKFRLIVVRPNVGSLRGLTLIDTGHKVFGVRTGTGAGIIIPYAVAPKNELFFLPVAGEQISGTNWVALVDGISVGLDRSSWLLFRSPVPTGRIDGWHFCLDRGSINRAPAGGRHRGVIVEVSVVSVLY